MRRLVIFALAAFTLSSSIARAEGEAKPRTAATDNLSGWLVLDPGSPTGIGLGARYLLPVVPEGLLRDQGVKVREELALEFGADFIHWGYDENMGPFGSVEWDVNAIEIVAGGMWNWWFTPKLALYPKIDVLYRYSWYSGWDSAWGSSGSGSDSDFDFNLAVGAMLKLEKVSLRIELGSHALRLGVAVKI